jgi:pantetheine-phosphate adenylyltransferase
MIRKAVYAGSFDPITNGHLWLVERGAELFDELVVAIGTNPEKHYTFTLEDRLDLLRQSLGHIPNVAIDAFENRYLVRYAKSVGARFILRGIRSASDYDFEVGMRHINSDMEPDITTVILMPPRQITEVSSSLVKGLIGPEGWREVVRTYVPVPVYSHILDRFGRDEG